MPKIRGCQISHRQLALCCDPVLAIIRVACLAGATTPSYQHLVRQMQDEHSIRVVPSEMTAIITTLVDRGDLATDGSKYHLAYVLPTGERTVAAPRGTAPQNVEHKPRQIMSEEEWRERFRDPLTGQIQRYEDDPRLAPGPIDWKLSARGRSFGTDGLGASSMHWR